MGNIANRRTRRGRRAARSFGYFRTAVGSTAIVAITAGIACTQSLHHRPVQLADPVNDWKGLDPLYKQGDVYFAGQPTADALREAKRRGTKVVVNLRSDAEVKTLEFDEPALAEELGLRYVSIPVTPATFSTSDADRLKEVLDETDGPTLIHCRSSNRCGALWALYLNRHRNVPLADALNHGRRAGLRSERLAEAIGAMTK